MLREGKGLGQIIRFATDTVSADVNLETASIISKPTKLLPLEIRKLGVSLILSA